MNVEHINGIDLARMLKAGCIKLEHHKERVNALNVFPVPDGDTGTNMYLTLMAAVREVEKEQNLSIGKVAKAISRGSLMGARGNSGVILSQVFRGMAKYLEDKQQATALEFALSLQAGADTAYGAVMKPVEGTILTIVRETAGAAVSEARRGSDMINTLLGSLEHGNRVLARTPQMLPILREAGVVDAGGQGFLYFLKGSLEALSPEKDVELKTTNREVKTEQPRQVEGDVSLDYHYCTEVLISGEDLDTRHITDKLKDKGDSLLVVGEDKLVKVHIHSNHPGSVLETCLEFGSLHDIKINNMLDESRERLQQIAAQPGLEVNQVGTSAKNIGVVAVGIGEGITRILESLGVDQVVEGGQTMNPSTEDLIRACERVDAANIIILPNNNNIILAAQQVKNLSDHNNIEVVPSTGIMQGIAALVAYDPNGELDDVVQVMNEEMKRVRSAEVTYSVRDTVIGGMEINEGNIIGIVDGQVKVVGSSVDEVVMEVLEFILTDGDELITLIYGEDVSPVNASLLKARLEEKYPLYDIEMHYGGQPHYHYFLSVE